MLFQDAQDMLNHWVSQKGVRYDLTPIRQALNALDNPHLCLPPVLHIAGTNGKGSTLEHIGHILMDQGVTIGTFNSPHLFSYCERIRLNHTPISQEAFTHLFEQALDTANTYHLTEFETLTLMSILYFQDQVPDILLYETGLGGRLDATNILMPLASILTPIGLDHQAILGDSITAIASEKAGIIKTQRPVFSAPQCTEARAVITQTCHDHNSPLFWAPPSTDCYINDNKALAYRVCQYLAQETSLSLDSTRFLSRLDKSTLWGRATTITTDTQTILIDCAHNMLGMTALLALIKRRYPNTPFSILCGFLARKDYADMVTQLACHAQYLFACDFSPSISCSIADLAPHCPDIQAYHLGDPLPKASLLVITGSMYFFEQIQPQLPIPVAQPI